MTIIAAKKGNDIYIGSIPKIAKLIGRVPMTVSRWAKKEKPVFYNGFEVYFNAEKL